AGERGEPGSAVSRARLEPMRKTLSRPARRRRHLVVLGDAALRAVNERPGRLDQGIGLALELRRPLGGFPGGGMTLGRFDRGVERVVEVVVTSHVESLRRLDGLRGEFSRPLAVGPALVAWCFLVAERLVSVRNLMLVSVPRSEPCLVGHSSLLEHRLLLSPTALGPR